MQSDRQHAIKVPVIHFLAMLTAQSGVDDNRVLQGSAILLRTQRIRVF